jgi:molybdopterin-guanine dinucleotide biosynthesis protein B
MDMPSRIHIVGRKNCGKTTLVCDLVRELTARGLRVATVKHTHHGHELDTPGKDSYLHRVAGAAGVGILSPQMQAMFVPIDRTLQGEQKYELFMRQFSDCDLLIVEGDLQARAPRFEVWRSSCGEAPYSAGDPGIQAVVSDDPVTGVSCPIHPRHDVAGLASVLVRHVLK